MSELRRAWLDLGRGGFLSTPVLVAFLAWAIPSAPYIEAIVSEQPAAPWLAISSGSALVVVLALLLVRRVARMRRPRGPGPWRALLIYALAGALRGLLLGLTAEMLGLDTPIGLGSRIANSSVWTLGIMGCAGIIVARRTSHRALMNGLVRRQRDLLVLQDTLGERIEQIRRDLVTQVQEELAPTLAQLRARLDSLAVTTDAGVEKAVEDFRVAVADVVRPLSRSLVVPDDRAVPVPDDHPGAMPSLAHERMPIHEAIAPGASAALVLVLQSLQAVVLAPTTYSAGAPARILVFVAGLWLGLSGLRGLTRRLPLTPTVPVLMAFLALAYAGLGIAVGLVARALTSGLAGQTPTFPALVAALAVLAPLAVSLAVIMTRLARRAELRSAETVAELDLLTAVLRRELWRERRRLALTVHGPLQSALVAAAVTMSRPGFTSEDVPALAATLDQAMAHVSRSAGPQPPIEAAARDLAALWTDSAQVAFTSGPEVTRILDSDEALRTAAIEVIREGVSNAIRHGAADRVSVALSRPAQGVLRLTIDDDGDGPPLASGPGLGTATFDEVSLDWSLTRRADGTRLEVNLGIDVNAAQALQATQVGTWGRSSSRANPMGPPQDVHTP